MAEPANVRLSLTNHSENVLLVREMLSGVAETIGLENSDLYDIRTAVTEACNNVVLHAYDGQEGPLEIELRATLEEVEVTVRDRGLGIRPRIRPVSEAVLGIGLPLIQALVHSVEFSEVDGGGTDVRMVFQAPSKHALEPVPERETRELARAPKRDHSASALLAIAPASLARTVLPRLLSVLAARANFSTDRISDTQIVADSLAAHVPGSIDGALRLTVRVKPRTLELCIGPLGAGSADRLILDSSVQGLGTVIEKLTDERRVASVGSAEMLALQLVDRP